MEAKAVAKNIRVSPQKVRVVLDMIRGKQVNDAFAYLDMIPKAASPIVKKLLKSAISNYDQKNDTADVDRLMVKTAYADKGMVLKRFRPRAMGRGSRINKYCSHITVIVG